MIFNQEFFQLNPKEHLIKNFDCKKKSINEFLIKYAAKHASKGISTTMVLTISDSGLVKLPVAAYYTLALSTIHRESIPCAGLSSYPIPVTLLARLAVDTNYQGKNLGKKSLIYALRHSVRLKNQGLPSQGLVLDVLDAEALLFYKTFNFFQECTDNPMKLYISMNELQKI
jgi:hypothetical protein